jgi:hypothetical protein
MNIQKRLIGFTLTIVLSFSFFTSVSYAQYTVGETISQDSRDRVVSFCANGVGTQTVGQLLSPGQGESARVLWLNFFESW